jgi:hypothetical protein
MLNASPPPKASEERGSEIPERPAHQRAKLGFAPASIIERAAQRLDWTIAFGMRHSTPHGPEEIRNQRSQPDLSWIARPQLGSSRAGGRRLRLISRLCLGSVLVGAAVSAGIFLLVHSVDENATAERALATKVPAKASGATYLIRGWTLMPAAVGTVQSAVLAGPAWTSASSDWEPKLSLEPIASTPGGPEPETALTPAAKAAETTSIFASAVAPNQPPLPAFSGAEIAALLARGDWLFATGDVAWARILYERAADAGEAQAAVRLGETFDPHYLHYAHLRGVHGNPGMARFWYRHARELGASGIASRLERLEAKEGRN